MLTIFIKRGKVMKGIAAVLLLFTSIVFIAALRFNNQEVFVPKKRKIPIYSVDTNEKKIAITFDASWWEDNTDQIIAILDKYNVKATFFLVGTWIDANADKLKLLHEKGHEIGNHTNSHPNMSSISKDRLIKEIEFADSKIRNITGEGTKIFRCPSGEYNDTVMEAVESTNKFCIQWDVDSIDWKNQGAGIELNRVLSKTKPGSILLFHNEAKFTPENLPKIIEYFQGRGYKMVTVSELIYKNNYIINEEGKQIYNK